MQRAPRTSLSLLARLATLALALALALAALAGPASAAEDSPRLEDLEQQMLLLHNQARAAAGLPPLDVHIDLLTDARRWSWQMASGVGLEHQTLEHSDLHYWQTSCAVADPAWQRCAENVGVGYRSVQAVHDAFMASPDHVKHILDSRVNRIGVGAWSDGDRIWWTVRFLRGTTIDTPDTLPHPQDEPVSDSNSGAASVHGAEGRVFRLYRAYFTRDPDQAGLEYWTARHSAGLPLGTISEAFATSEEFTATYGSVSDATFVALVYQNVLGRSADAAGAAFWTSQLAGGLPRGELMIGFSESAEFRTQTGIGR